jgi:hypothetical protein
MLVAALGGTTASRAAAPLAPALTATVLAPVTTAGVDLHDGQILKVGTTYYWYGTMYGCGFQWGQSGPWCGFGVSMSSALTGPWSTPQLLFSPQSTDPWTGTTWAAECGSTGAGCFNPRMIVRTGWGPNDGVPILWFNSPADYSRSGANAYNVMGCNSLTGPCGPTAGPPYGSYNKPPLYVCSDNGDFSLISIPGQLPAIVCTMAGSSPLNIEQLNEWGAGGTGVGARTIGSLTGVESPGMWRDTATGSWVLTYSDPYCGYCAGTSTGYATASSPYGPWSAPGNVGWAAPSWSRRSISADSCGGQPRTVSVLDGQPWQVVDLWRGTANETSAGTHLQPLVYDPALGTGTPGDGGLHRPPFTRWTCN